jgi:hypothetical protein
VISGKGFQNSWEEARKAKKVWEINEHSRLLFAVSRETPAVISRETALF